ncbi:hypothetical protein [Cellulomonas xiejunii]|uniref:DUF222 domain-containing protein n=1 Tax=Cellulomonas xiejunii TaxID=2968083 RepID=A0ABY5KVG5_9CELL|nr:hypothetical protein [Cellulomonas xiejunii]MCC2321936.1 hypothetical protein [Cellulomonas xiejunii]UUI73237.1 hypothetical protein NP048_07320 [Cellulomonas xiejunii]
MESSEQRFLHEIRSTYADLERWRVRASSVEEPERGSELAVDDHVFPRHRISSVAWLSLALAGEHLRLARDAIEAQQLYPSAHFSVLRSALVGAAQGVWILGPDHGAQRQERGLIVLAEMHEQMRKYYNRLSDFALSDQERTELVAQQEWLAQRVEEVARARTGRQKLELTTTVIPEALDLVFPDSERRQQGRALWYEMSGDAHVLGWSTIPRGSVIAADRLSGLATHVVGGSLDQISQPFIASYKMLRVGWSLYDRRCEGR